MPRSASSLPCCSSSAACIQGLALGGEYGGAATYVAEHAPQNRRGYYTSWIQTTATVGLFLSLIVVLVLRLWLTPAQFAEWGWRVPFLLSILLLGVSIWIRLQLQESPAFQRIKDAGKGSKTPLREAFGRWKNAKIALLALFGGTAGQAAVWYCGQFYALFFLTQTLKLDGTTSNIVIAVALAIGTPFFVFFGWLSDKIGRKPIILAGCLLAVVTYFPLFQALTNAVNPQLEQALEKSPVVVTADPGECSFQFNPTGTASFTSSCDIAKSFLARNAVNYSNVAAPAGTPATIKIGDKVITSFDKVAAGADGCGQGEGLQRPGDRGHPRRRLSGRGRPGQGQHVDDDPHPDDPRPLRDDGLRPDRRHAGRALPDPHPLLRHVAALSHRQRLVRRLPAAHRLRHRGGDRQYLLGPVVSDRDRGDDLRHRPALRAGDQGSRHLRRRQLTPSSLGGEIEPAAPQGPPVSFCGAGGHVGGPLSPQDDAMNLDAIAIGHEPPEDVNTIIEVPIGGEPIKYEMDKAAGTLVVDRFLYTPMRYPGNYGFVPHTLSDDGDPIDVLVANTRPIIPGAVMNVRPIGVLKMEDDGGGDEKIIAVPSSRITQRYVHVKTHTDLPEITRQQIEHFFIHYKDLEPGKWVKLQGWGDVGEARRLIVGGDRSREKAQMR